MKSTLVLLAAAASLEQATATLFGGVGSHPGINLGSLFPSPSNADNTCNPWQEAGWDWSDLAFGKVSTYHGFDLSGWTCKNSLFKRGAVRGRTFGLLSKLISGICQQDVATAPSISCGGSSGIDAFSIDNFLISTEFDCLMEFHYEMPGGDICQTSQDCSTSGTTVTNTKCGGAKKVSFVFPKQPNVGTKTSCQIGIHKINWHCNKNPHPSTSIAVTTLGPHTSLVQTTPGTGAPTTATGAPTTAPGTPTTAPGTGAPTTAPGTPTTAPGTGAPTTAPGTPTTVPGTDASTTAPGTDTPTTASGTDTPTTAPGTGAPTTAPGTPTTVPGGTPTTVPGTGAPTTAPGTDTPTTVPGTGAPTTAPGTGAPTTAPGTPTTAPGTDTPTTVPGTGAPTTAPGTGAPTTVPGTGAPTTAPGTGAPTTAPGTGAPTTALGTSCGPVATVTVTVTACGACTGY